ncbi:MAG: VOC family protein [Sphingopyxis sp.]
MTNPPGSFIWYELMTSDPDGAAAFYGAVVGWTIAAHSDPGAPGDVDYRMIVRTNGGNAGGVLALTPDMAAGGARPGWLGYIYTPDVDAAIEAMTADGGILQMPATDLPVGRMAMVADPQGAPFYIMNPIPPEGEPDKVADAFSMTEPQHMRWNELATSDPDAALAFYQKHFGWGQDGALDMGELGQYRFLQHDGEMMGAVMPLMGSPVPMWNFYIGVDDIDRAVAAIAANGGKVVTDPQEIPGGEYSANGVDPQGASFGLVGPRNN